MRTTRTRTRTRLWVVRAPASRATLLAVVAAVAIAACSGAPADPGESSGSTSPGRSSGSSSSSGPSQSDGATTESASPSPESGPDVEIRPLPRRQWRAMVEAGMVRPQCPVKRPRRLRLVEVNHYTFDGGIRRGQLVVNADVAESVGRIFTKLYEAEFPIRKMVPVEEFDGDTNASLAADNTSAFNCRRADQINAPFMESPHANGRAVDINPRENPWQDLRCDCWLPSPRFRAREEGPGKILKGGLVWRTFRAEGWIWQNIPVADYMHFDTGYPSRRFDDRGAG